MSLGDGIHTGRLHAAAPQGPPSASAGGGAGQGRDTGGGSAGRRMPYVDRVLHVLLDIAAGMAHIHAKSVIHGDLKPQVAFDHTGAGADIALLVGGASRIWLVGAAAGTATSSRGRVRFYQQPHVAATASPANPCAPAPPLPTTPHKHTLMDMRAR
jgi:hypothetical protein